MGNTYHHPTNGGSWTTTKLTVSVLVADRHAAAAIRHAVSNGWDVAVGTMGAIIPGIFLTCTATGRPESDGAGLVASMHQQGWTPEADATEDATVQLTNAIGPVTTDILGAGDTAWVRVKTVGDFYGGEVRSVHMDHPGSPSFAAFLSDLYVEV